MSVDVEMVRKVAKLARMSLADDEAARLVNDLSAILAHAAELQTLDLQDVPPTAHAVALTCPTRDDTPRHDPVAEHVLARAPEHEGTAFKVPKIIE